MQGGASRGRGARLVQQCACECTRGRSLPPTHPPIPPLPPTPLLLQYECRLCLTLHTNEGNYLAHTQGKRHQQNLAKRAAREAADRPIAPAPMRRVAVRRTVKIGRPGYRVTRQFNPDAESRGLLFQVCRRVCTGVCLLEVAAWMRPRRARARKCLLENAALGTSTCPPLPLPQVEYPEIEEGVRPRHRVMSSYEQRKEPTDRRYQYILFAAEPYETIAFKVPAYEVDRNQEASLFTHW